MAGSEGPPASVSEPGLQNAGSDLPKANKSQGDATTGNSNAVAAELILSLLIVFAGKKRKATIGNYVRELCEEYGYNCLIEERDLLLGGVKFEQSNMPAGGATVFPVRTAPKRSLVSDGGAAMPPGTVVWKYS